ncbi:putative mucus-binding protein [Leuconostoc carnosum JB16]|uniref:Putative mucus-binding protein n=2 Tax=Leuconostoc carnosum TaxID=1252 RepID=K0D554_LEUCJ|nr:KxYKxGKxW signal peptide domain-containing protein [Leuconostoc carnosum]AFT80974.1 putative mucus-binding protein [Leuconostoc carnosum JB16]
MQERRSHFKMYKDGKQWVVAGLTLATVFIGSNFFTIDKVNADEKVSTTSSIPSSSTKVDSAKSDKPSETKAVSPSDKPSDLSVSSQGGKIDNQTSSTTIDKSVPNQNLDKAVQETKDAGVTVTEDTKSAQKTDIQGMGNADTNTQVKDAQKSDSIDYDKQIADLTDAKKQQADYEKALNAGKHQNADGKTQIATSGNAQALALDQSKPADETAPTGTIKPTDTYSGNDPKKGDNNTKTSTKIWEYSGDQVIGATITKKWTKAGTITVRNNDGKLVERTVDLTETFHDFQRQNGNWTDTSNYKEQGTPKVRISSNAIDNVEMFNVNWQTTFWFTYSDSGQIVPISKMTGTNDDPKVYFLSGSLSSSPYTGPDSPTQWDNWDINRREYVQTNDAKTAVIAAGSTIGLGNISGSDVANNAPEGQAYTNISGVYHDANDDDPDVYALKEGVSFTDFTTDKPTLYLGAVPINKTARWWHSNKNMNSDELAFVQKPKASYHKNSISYTQVPIKIVNETIHYVHQDGSIIRDKDGKSIDYSTTDTDNIKFIIATDKDGTPITWTSKGDVSTTPTIVAITKIDPETGKETTTQEITDGDWTKGDSSTFATIANPDVPNYSVISTDDPANDLTQTTAKTVDPNSGDITYTVVYAPAYTISDTKTVNETVHYVDQTGKTVANDAKATPVNFVTVTNPVDGSTTTYYSTTATKPTLDNNGVPTGDWTKGDWTEIPAITNPDVTNHTVISTDDPANDLTQTTAKTVDSTSGDLDYTVVYAVNKESANVTYIDDITGKTLESKDLSGDYNSTDSYRTTDTISNYESKGYKLVSDDYPTNGVVYDQDGVEQHFEVHLTHSTVPVTPDTPQVPGDPIDPNNPDGPKWPEGTDKDSLTQTITRTINYLDKQTGQVVSKQVTQDVTYNRTAIIDKVSGELLGYDTNADGTPDTQDATAAWRDADGNSWAATTSPDLSGQGYAAPSIPTVDEQTVNPGDKNANVNVYYDHSTTQTTESKTINETIHYQYSDGSKAHADYNAKPIIFVRTVTTDNVTGNKIYGNWTMNSTTFGKVISPNIVGYTPDQAEIDALVVNADSLDIVKTVTYTANQKTPNDKPEKPTNTTPKRTDKTVPSTRKQHTNSSKTSIVPKQHVTHSNANQDKEALPKTGQSTNSASTILAGIVSIATLGLVSLKRRKH